MSQTQKVQTKRKAIVPLGQVAFLVGLWLLLSGKMDVFHVGSGVLAAVFVVWLDRKLGSATLRNGEPSLRLHVGRALLYLGWLGWQMLLATWQVGRVIVSPAMLEKIDPKLVRFRSRQPQAVARVVLGNSITLTPGTLTVEVEEDVFLVHALTRDSADSLREGTMQRKVAGVFGRDLPEPVTDWVVLNGRPHE